MAADTLEGADEQLRAGSAGPPTKALSIELSDSHGHSEGAQDLDPDSPLHGQEDTAHSGRLGAWAAGAPAPRTMFLSSSMACLSLSSSGTAVALIKRMYWHDKTACCTVKP